MVYKQYILLLWCLNVLFFLERSWHQPEVVEKENDSGAYIRQWAQR